MAKHLTYDDRLEIEGYLKQSFSLSGISRELNRHKSLSQGRYLLGLLSIRRGVLDEITTLVSIGMTVILIIYAKKGNV
ncbi:MAG: helix-turn-helix domain-containing protein [Tissierella sp.]|nr:helix-turn-helix domain-containing protein [Tissierella sp.]